MRGKLHNNACWKRGELSYITLAYKLQQRLMKQPIFFSIFRGNKRGIIVETMPRGAPGTHFEKGQNIVRESL